MSQNNSSTESKKSPSSTVLLHLSTGAAVICDVLGSDATVLLAKAPMELDVLFDEDGDIRDFMMRPYMYPFSFAKAETLVTFSVSQICSVQAPHPLIHSYYLKSLDKLKDSPVTNQTDDQSPQAEDETPTEKTKPPATKAKVTYH